MSSDLALALPDRLNWQTSDGTEFYFESSLPLRSPSRLPDPFFLGQLSLLSFHFAHAHECRRRESNSQTRVSQTRDGSRHNKKKERGIHFNHPSSSLPIDCTSSFRFRCPFPPLPPCRVFAMLHGVIVTSTSGIVLFQKEFVTQLPKVTTHIATTQRRERVHITCVLLADCVCSSSSSLCVSSRSRLVVSSRRC